MWWRSVRGDKTSSRGPDGSPRGPDGLGIPSRPAPASTSKILVEKLELALRAATDDEDKVGHGLLLNLAIGQVEQAIQRWRAEDPSLRHPSFIPLGRPTVLEEDVQLLLDLRKAKPGSDCRKEFTAARLSRGLTKGTSRTRYRDAVAKIESVQSL